MNDRTVILGCWPPCGVEQTQKVRTIDSQDELRKWQQESFGGTVRDLILEPVYVCARSMNDREAVAVCRVVGDIILTKEEAGLYKLHGYVTNNNVEQFHTTILNEAQFKTFRDTKTLPEWYYRGMYVYLTDSAHGHMATVIVMEKEKPETAPTDAQWEEPDED